MSCASVGRLLRAEKVASCEVFLSETILFRAADPIGTNLLGSVVLSYSGKTKDSIHLWIVREDSSNNVVGLAARTDGRPLLIVNMPAEAARVLALRVMVDDEQFPGINGPLGTALVFLQALVDSGSARFIGCNPPQLKHKTVSYELPVGSLHKPPNSKTVSSLGSSRLATLDDFDIMLKLCLQFHEDTGMDAKGFDMAVFVRDKLEAGLWWLWIDEKGKVAGFGGHSFLVDIPGGVLGRVGPIFTCASHRRQGIGSALTVTIVEELLRRGAKVMLFADAENQGTNEMYQKLGFKQVGGVCAEFWL